MSMSVNTTFPGSTVGVEFSLFSHLNAKTIGLGLILFILVAFKFSQSRPKGKLPPGPPGLPILGNLHQLAKRPWLSFTDWRKRYGPLVYVNFAGQGVLLIGSHKVAGDLLDRRATLYSDRPRWIVASELLTGGLVIAFAQHNELWKRMRRGAHEALNNTIAKNYYPIQENEAFFLVENLLNTPANFDMHLRRAASSTVMRITYGLPPLKDSNDPIILRVNDFVDRALSAALPGKFLVEYFTWMEHLPRWMAPWRRWAEEWFARDSQFVEGLYKDTIKRIHEGDKTDETSCVVANLMSDHSKQAMSEKEAAWLSAVMYAAGGDTTSAQMAWFMMAMILHPEVQAWAQAEIDRVVGRDRMPNFADIARLPCVKAIVKENMRWRGVAPMSNPHCIYQDDWYDGYFIPRGTLVIANVWHMNHDPDVYGPDAEEYRPTRHLDSEGNLLPATPETKDESHLTYGFGRRICVGRHVSNNSMYIQVASILWAFRISAGKDENGMIVLPNPEDCRDEGLVVRPAPFPVTIVPRCPEVVSVIAQAKDFWQQRAFA